MKHRRPRAGSRAGRVGAVLLSGVVVLVTTSATGSEATAPVAPVVGIGSGRALTMAERAICRSTVGALLSNELLQVATGRPDSGAATSMLIMRSYRGEPVLLARLQGAEQQLRFTAAADLVSRYAMDVAAEVRGYAPRIVAACR
ncbi:MAG: hypothetical protein ACR2N4_14855 [Jatrophihabitans sp.]